MTEKKRKISVFDGLVKIFKSRVSRSIFFIITLVLAVLCMFMLDKSNYIRDQYLPFLNSNFIQGFMSLIGIHQYNMPVNAWMVFLCIALFALIFILGGIFRPKFVNKFATKNQDAFATPKRARFVYSLAYTAILFLIGAVIIFISVMAGAFDNFNSTTASVLLNVLYVVLLCLLFIVLVILAISIVYTVIKLLIIGIAYLVSKISSTSKVIDENSPVAIEIGIGASSNGDLFPSLTAIDNQPANEPTVSDEVSLSDLALRFQSYAINNHKIYYELPLIRSFIAGLAATKLIILEGLSGTGKSMLPRMFAKFTQSNASFTPVQATWRDKTDVLGFYSEFTKSYKTTDFLKNLYSASYNDKINTMVLDEVNLSRIEYYFADFLSILEYPAEDWKIRIYEPQLNQKLPAKLDDGYVTIPENTWFIGTANTDDSTFTITDKVYDRAIIIDFSEKISPIKSSYNSDPINISADKLNELLNQAIENKDLQLTDKDIEKFIRICDFTKEAFDIRFGNRIMVQIEEFVPVYVALGGTKEEALDFMFARKILRKLHGAYEDYIKDELARLTKLINEVYGKGVFKETERLIAKINKRLV